MKSPAFHGRAGQLVVLSSLGLLCLAALLSLPALRIDPRITVTLPRGSAASELEGARALFPDPNHLLIALPAADPFAEESLGRLSALSSRFEEMGNGMAKGSSWTLLSPCTTEDILLVDGRLTALPLVPREGERSAILRKRLAASPLLSRFFLSENGRAWNLYLETSLEGKALLGGLEILRAEFPELRFSGIPYYMALQSRILEREFPLLIAFAALALLLAEWALIQEFRTALLLWAFALAPTLLLIGLFPASGTPLRISLVLAPIITLAVSTSYTTHLYHGWSVAGRDPVQALRDRGDIILLDALTTALGFGSLVLSPIPELRILGLFSAIGVVLALSTAILGLGAFLRLAPGVSAAQLRYAALAAPLPAPSARRRSLSRLAWVGLAALLAIGAAPLRIGKSNSDLFRPGSPRAAELEYFLEDNGGFDEISLILDTGEEYGIVDLELFRSVARLEIGLETMDGVGAVYGYPELVGEALARWEGRPGSLEPRSAEEIGEALELLSGLDAGLFSRGFVNPDWSAARLRIGFEPGAPRTELVSRLRTFVASAGLRAKSLFSGDIVEGAEVERLFVSGQGSGLLVFFGLLILVLWVFFRSLPRALLVAATPATGILASIVMMNLFGWRLSEINSLALAAIAGIGVDDALMMAAKGNSRETRRAILETTILISSALAVLFFSDSFIIIQTAVISVFGMVVSTVLALYILPAVKARSVLPPKDSNA